MRGTTTGLPHEVDRLRAAIAVRLGLAVSEERTGSLLDLLERRCRATGRSVAEYLVRVEQDAEDDEIQVLGRALTIPETHFFRDSDQFRALSELVLPERVRARRSERQLRLLSLGCASGEEAYSLAIAAQCLMPDAMWQLSVTGIDVNGAALEKARAGRYSAWSLRATTRPQLTRWFRRSGETFVLDDAVRAAVRLEQGNLAAARASWHVPGHWDVVFLRNVLMYFTPEQARVLVGRVEHALAPGGYLFLGHAETLRGISDAYELQHTHGTFYYRRPLVPTHASLSTTSSIQPTTSSLQRSVAAPHRTRRVPTGASGPTQARTHDVTTTSPETDGDTTLQHALELFAREGFAEVDALLASLPATKKDDPELTLVRGTSLLQQGHIDAAADLARSLLASHERHADAHHLLALCLEAAGDTDAAVREWQTCIRLAPAAGLAHLHLGRLSRRSGDVATATRSLATALVLLPMEKPRSLLLFGGGFTPASLLDLCQAELTRCGAPNE